MRRDHVLVQLHTPVAQFDQAWRRAIHDRGASTGPSASAAERAACALDALALGDFVTARHLLAGLSAEPDLGLASDFYVLVVARYFAATADIALTRQEWPRVRAALEGKTPDTDLLRELAITAESIGEPADRAELLAAASADRGSAARDPVLSAYLHPSHTVAELGAPAHGLDPAWPPGRMAAFVRGVLGFEPDAARNRVVLRPTLPADWDQLTVDNLAVGDGTLGLHYRRAVGQHMFRLLPLAGAIPLRVVFEPRIIGDRVSAVRVDGQLAELKLERVAGRWACPVQIELDRERVLSIETVGIG